MIANRNSIGFEVDPEIVQIALSNMNQRADTLNETIHKRIEKHIAFIEALPQEKKCRCYQNLPHGFLVKTKQEVAIELEQLSKIEKTANSYICHYEKYASTSQTHQITLTI